MDQRREVVIMTVVSIGLLMMNLLILFFHFVL